MKNLIVCLLVILVSISCREAKKVDYEIYDGPDVTLRDIDMLVSDSTIVKLRLQAKTQLELASGDREFPDGIFLQFYNDLGQLSSTLVAKSGYYFSKEDYYQAEGDVVMESIINGDELSTERLLWTPAAERIHTDNFVTIKSEDEVLTGEGLEASQNFEEYTILNPSGTMAVARQSQPAVTQSPVINE